MKKLNALNLGKSLTRGEMKSVNGGLVNDPYCYCTIKSPGTLTHCGCNAFCDSEPGC